MKQNHLKSSTRQRSSIDFLFILQTRLTSPPPSPCFPSTIRSPTLWLPPHDPHPCYSSRSCPPATPALAPGRTASTPSFPRRRVFVSLAATPDAPSPPCAAGAAAVVRKNLFPPRARRNTGRGLLVQRRACPHAPSSSYASAEAPSAAGSGTQLRLARRRSNSCSAPRLELSKSSRKLKMKLKSIIHSLAMLAGGGARLDLKVPTSFLTSESL
mmetsp:Transcript_13815/g.34042  ORF Transcript_13815/g.34042 Transcript_13815/m.34042 type:complete len:213 (+) Transcript_13815:386-1024(+)